MPDVETGRRPSLAGAFAPPARAPKPEPAVPQDATVSSDPVPAESQNRAGSVAQSPDEPVGNVACHLPPELRAKLLQTSRTRGISITDLFLEALDDVLDAVDQGRIELFPQQPSATRSGMPMHRRRRTSSRGTIQVQLRLTPPQKQWLDKTSENHRADSRSAFVTAVLSEYLS